MYPHLYPTADFTDTGIQQHYQHTYSDNANRVVSIGYSWTRKVLSSVRVYAEQRDLAFFLYEKHLAMKYIIIVTIISITMSIIISIRCGVIPKRDQRPMPPFVAQECGRTPVDLRKRTSAS